MGKFEYGTGQLGRLKYRTEGEARAAGDDLGLEGIHSHRMDADDDGQKEDFAMPGKNHNKLNDALSERGLDTTPVPGQMDGSEMGDDMLDADLSMADGMGMVGGEMTEAGSMGLDEATVKLDGMGMGGELTTSQMDGFVGELSEEMAKYDASGLDGEAFDGENQGLENGLDALEGRDRIDPTPGDGGMLSRDALRGSFVGDEDDDGSMEIY